MVFEMGSNNLNISELETCLEAASIEVKSQIGNTTLKSYSTFNNLKVGNILPGDESYKFTGINKKGRALFKNANEEVEVLTKTNYNNLIKKK